MKNIKKTKEIIENLNDLPIYIAGHLKPDQDSVGSCLALAEFLKAYGKKACVLLEEKDKDILNWKGDYSLVTSEVVHDKYNFFMLDMNEKKRLGSFEKWFDEAEFTVNIDHHQDNKFEADHTVSEPGISSTCEMIFEIISAFGKDYLTKSICEYLYAGMMNDTNCFSRRLSSKTLAVAQKLINKKIDYTHIIKKTFSERSFYEFKALAKLVSEIKEDDGFNYVVVDKSKEEFSKLSHNAIVKQIAEDLRKIEGFDVFLMLIKNTDSIVAKVMSNISSNADKIATVFGGGGHKKEAGFTVKDMTIEEIVEQTRNHLKQN